MLRKRNDTYHHNHTGGLGERFLSPLLLHPALLIGRDHVCHQRHHQLQIWYELPDGSHDIRVNSRSPLRVRLFRSGDSLPLPTLVTLLSPGLGSRSCHKTSRLSRVRIFRGGVLSWSLPFVTCSLSLHGLRRPNSGPLWLTSKQCRGRRPGGPNLSRLTWGRSEVGTECSHICKHIKRRK